MTVEEFNAEVSRYVKARKAGKAVNIAVMQVNAAEKMLRGANVDLEMVIKDNQITSLSFLFPTKITKLQNGAMQAIDLSMSMLRAALLVCSDAEVQCDIRRENGIWVCSVLQDMCGFVPSDELLDHFHKCAAEFGEDQVPVPETP